MLTLNSETSRTDHLVGLPINQFERCICKAALAETNIGPYKAEVIHQRSFEAVEFAILEWVNWFNNRRLLESVGNIPPPEAEANYYAALEQTAIAA